MTRASGAVALFCAAAGLAGPAWAAPAPAASLQTIPTGKGLPVLVRAAVSFPDVLSFDENQGRFEATTDVRLTWVDLRLRYPAEEGLHGYKEYRMSAAEAEIAKIWSPRVRIVNRIEEPSLRERRLRLFPDGTVEIIERTTAAYKTPIDVTRFPFDRQPLQVELRVQEDTAETVDLIHRREDVDFTRIASDVVIDGWTPGMVGLRKEVVRGWNGDRYAQVVAVLDVQRIAASSVPTIFIPLFASLLIPFMATWMNAAQDDGTFAVEAFELANVVIGGLFAVIALSFTISSAYPAIAAADNTVTRLIALNYVALAAGTLVTVILYRYRFPARLFGPHFQKAAFDFISWGMPLLFLSTGVALVLASAA